MSTLGAGFFGPTEGEKRRRIQREIARGATGAAVLPRSSSVITMSGYRAFVEDRTGANLTGTELEAAA